MRLISTRTWRCNAPIGSMSGGAGTFGDRQFWYDGKALTVRNRLGRQVEVGRMTKRKRLQYRMPNGAVNQTIGGVTYSVVVKPSRLAAPMRTAWFQQRGYPNMSEFTRRRTRGLPDQSFNASL